MRKCIYITDDGWWDTDITILPQIVDDYEITVVVAENTNQLKYDEKKYQAYKTLSNLIQNIPIRILGK